MEQRIITITLEGKPEDLNKVATELVKASASNLVNFNSRVLKPMPKELEITFEKLVKENLFK